MDAHNEEGEKGKQRPTEVLDIEDEEQRHERIHGLFSRLNASTAGAGPQPPIRPFESRDRSTFAVEPPLELLSRVQAFLPELAASNADLLQRAREDPSSVDIESVNAEAPQYIEMNVGLGVFEQHGEAPPGIPVADVDFDRDVEMSSSEDGDDSSSASSGSDSSDEDSGSSSDDEDSDVDIVVSSSSAQPATARRIKPLPKRAAGKASGNSKPEIVVLSESDNRSA
ncbi:hypothetical protein L226DRAFT_531321 [Lentinus tigrinus ALCF2SS1-7]|uniref:Uncharacterized protein n=1 Tax=Lentinus tigrinus ALCF2SS1-6 TaxID=1328759 RepID=A0A5C2RZN6_9APHY|nr:hypothetical protein L227DRAFT_553430 [Lentinus tigrinus ALCF2SS1-6]RPD79556.1 hypothetical protein L226DRAFT_531321 [Lentinus tigrinus ALCF2SS1-7]